MVKPARVEKGEIPKAKVEPEMTLSSVKSAGLHAGENGALEPVAQELWNLRVLIFVMCFSRALARHLLLGGLAFGLQLPRLSRGVRGVHLSVHLGLGDAFGGLRDVLALVSQINLGSQQRHRAASNVHLSALSVWACGGGGSALDV